MTDDLIRNIGQSHQERPIIKVAPDMVVYINNLPYVINPYISPNPVTGGTYVNINDYVTAISGSNDINTPIPTATISLSVPNHLRYLFQGPGGQRFLNTMADVKIYGKGYYMTDKGESVYHRVFSGVLTTVSYSDNKKTLDITLACRGILHLMDIMQVNQSPAAMNNLYTGSTINGFMSKWPDANPLNIIVAMFTRVLSFDVDDPESVDAQNTVSKKQFDRIYIAQWTKKLQDMLSDLRIFGLSAKDVQAIGQKPISDSMTAPAAAGNPSPTKVNEAKKMKIRDRPQDQLQVTDMKRVQQFTPDFKMGDIKLAGSLITSRLAKVQEVVTKIGWELYQDLDGSIVIKPQLYNLDVTNTHTYPGAAGDDQPQNPFVIHYPEIIGAEVETEDESQVRLTRTVIQGTVAGTPMLGDAANPLLPGAEHIDVAMISQFGLRTEPMKALAFIGDNKYMAMAYAVQEMAKINGHWRTYSCTIPFRPELRLGFPIYLPHLDIYGYLTNITWNYSRGGDCTMSLNCSNLRTRYMVGQKNTVNNAQGVAETTYSFTAIPNLIYRWSNYNPSNPGINAQGVAVDMTNPAKAVNAPVEGLKKPSPSLPPTDRAGGSGQTTKVAPPKNPPGGPDFVWQVTNDFALPYTDRFKNVPGDLGQTQTPSDPKFFTEPRLVDWFYFQDILQNARPCSDAKGYTVVGPFPAGRYLFLEDVLNQCTRPSSLWGSKDLLYFKALQSQNKAVPGAQASPGSPYLMAGFGTPQALNPVTGEDTSIPLKTLQDAMENNIVCFVLSYDGADPNTLSALSPNVYNGTGAEGVLVGPPANAPTAPVAPPGTAPVRPAATSAVLGATMINHAEDYQQ